MSGNPIEVKTDEQVVAEYIREERDLESLTDTQLNLAYDLSKKYKHFNIENVTKNDTI